MSLRAHYVPSYPPLSVNGPPPPHHQTHRVQAVPVSIATALQQQAAAAQQQSQGTTSSNQNSGGNVQAPQTHEYHITSCLPFQTPAGVAQNIFRHISNGGYAHPQSQTIYQPQGGVVQNQQPQQSNPAQSLSNQQNQARLTPMSQPTAPPTPPNQQQQSQAPQYAVQLQQQGIPGGGGAGNPRAQQYRSQGQVPRRQQQPINQQFFYQSPMGQYGFVIPQNAHVRAPAYGYMPIQPVFNNYASPAQQYGQMTVQSNGQQRQSTPQTTVPAMAPPQANEYPYQSMVEGYQPVMQVQPVTTQPQPPPQHKTRKSERSKAIQIINPATGKDIFEDDPLHPSTGGATGGSIATVDKAITASHNELNKDEAVDKEASTSTPVVSAMSDGPSVDITPKHQVNKIKKLKPPEPLPVPVVTSVQLPLVSNEIVAPTATKEETEPQAVPAVPHIPQDNENNNNNVTVAASVATPAFVPTDEPVSEVKVAKSPVVVSLDVNDTNNNNYQKVTKPEANEEKEVPVTKKVAEPLPQDSNNNSTDDKAVMTSPSIRQTTPEPMPAPVKDKEEKPAAVVDVLRKVSVSSLIAYDDGQWSPANLSGKKYYTRDQLLKLKDQPVATAAPLMSKLPDNFANTLMKNNKDVLSNTLNQTMPLPNMSSMQRNVGQFDPTLSVQPKFMANQQMGGRNPYQKRPSQQGNKQQMPGNGRGSQAGIIKLTLSLQDDVKLNEAENAWKPSHLVKKQDMTEEENVTYELLSRFRSMLNKLTAENFGLLVEEVKTYKIDTSERLDGVISLVFEKAISEPKFAPTYANLCKEVAFITTAPIGQGEGGQKKNTLKSKLITQCQKEFERHREESIVFNNIEEKLREIENLPEHEKRDDEKARLEEEHYKVRQRANGTVKFIGELFKIEMLTPKIMKACIEMLLQEVTEEKIERVCKLLTTIGGKIEKAEGRAALEKYFSQLNEMLHPSHKIIRSSRIKFEIQNLQDLRNNNWQARRQDLTPKTMDQIQMESDREQQMINYQTRQNAKEDRNRGNQGGYNNNNNNRRQQQDSDGWSVQHNNKSRVPITFSKLSIPSTSMGTEGTKLGNPADYQKFMVQTNKFSGLPIDPDTDGPQARFGGVSGGGSKNSSMERGSSRDSRFFGNGSSDGRYSGRSSGSNQGSRNSSQIRSRDNSDSRGGPSRSLQPPPRHQQVPPSGGSSSMSFSGALKQPQKQAVPAEPMSREDIEKNFKEMLATVSAYRDDKLTLDAAITKLKPLSINKDVLVEIYNQFLDRKDIDRENLMLLIIEALKVRKLTREDNRLALIETMDLAPDMQCDVPRVYEYIAQFLAELLIASLLTFQDVYQICEAHIKSEGENMLRYIFVAIEKRHGAGILKQIVTEANLDLGKFISDGNFIQWLEVNKFANMVRHGTNGVADVMAQVRLMLDDKKTHDLIISYINSTDCTNDPNFIRDLTTVVVENSCDEYQTGGSDKSSFKLRNARLEEFAQLLQRYIDSNPEKELQCIYALQNFAFARQYPQGLLNLTFEILYDADVLSAEAFEVWQKSEGPKESQQGKGVAVASTRQFFTKLAEDKDDDDPDYFGDEVEQL